MKPVSEHHRVEAYRNAPENVREFYVSESLTDKLDVLYTSFKIPVAFREFSTIIGDLLLGFYTLSEAQKKLQELGISHETAKNIIAQLTTLLEKILVPTETAITLQKSDLQKLAEAFAEKSRLAQRTPTVMRPTEQTYVKEKSPQTPADQTTKLQPVRTMQNDIERIHGYDAYNDALEKGEIVHTTHQDDVLRKR